MKKILKNKGIILAETLMAISLCVTVAIVAGYLVNDAISTTILSRNFLIAKNLANEGIEVVKNIRDTNWLKNPDDKTYWLNQNPDVGYNNPVTAGSSYIVTKNIVDHWILSNTGITSALDLANGETATMDPYRLYLVSAGDANNPYTKYTHVTNNTPSIFYREIKCVKLTPAATPTEARFEVKLQWKEGSKVRTISKSLTLYNTLE